MLPRRLVRALFLHRSGSFSKPEATEYWFDVYPEENTTITEEFFVTQKGVFQTPAVVIESLYAPHYRANDKPATVVAR